MRFDGLAAGLSLIVFCGGVAHGAVSLGTGSGALIGNDLTDRDDVNDETAYDVHTGGSNFAGFDGTFSASEEEGFGGGEFAFNVFDNDVGGGSAKWCCGDDPFPMHVTVEFDQPVILTRFTVASSNDTPARDPRVWQLLGSNDGIGFSPIFSQNNPGAALWTQRNEVLRFDGYGADFALPGEFRFFRLNTDATGATSGAKFAINEIELFGLLVPEPSMVMLLGLGFFGVVAHRRRSR